MRRIKMLLLGALLLAGAGGTLLIGPTAGFAQQRAAERRAERNYWRYHEGKWSHWDTGDKRWYYTNGEHWYYHNGKAWAPYRFDKTFGREGFERGKYVVPADGTTIVVPSHPVYVPG